MKTLVETDVAVIGAGPAGLSAAATAAECGARVLVLDEYPEPGGQYYKRLPAAFRVDDHRTAAEFRKGDALLARAQSAGVALWNDALVWAGFEPGVLSVSRAGEQWTVRARAIVVAAGAYERPAVFPGWDLPGVMTPGGAQTLVKNQQTLPGERIVVAGSGPFLLPVAKTLIDAGARIVALYEATGPAQWWQRGRGALLHGARMREAAGYAMTLLAARVRPCFHRVVVRAEGAHELERVISLQCDAAGRVLPGTERIDEADVLCAGYGFIPAVQATRMLGCSHEYVAARGGWVPQHGDDMETSVANVFIAGEVAGIGGVHVALAEGELAGAMAARKLGFAVPESRVERARAARVRHRSFADLVSRIFAPGVHLDDLITDATLVCRCEEVSAGAIRTAAPAWAPNVNFVKGVTRCGMGLCQGRICGSVAERLVARALERDPGTVDSFHVRLPMKPVSLAELAAMEDQ